VAQAEVGWPVPECGRRTSESRKWLRALVADLLLLRREVIIALVFSPHFLPFHDHYLSRQPFVLNCFIVDRAVELNGS